jgi:hypothetical protein
MVRGDASRKGMMLTLWVLCGLNGSLVFGR